MEVVYPGNQPGAASNPRPRWRAVAPTSHDQKHFWPLNTKAKLAGTHCAR
jgi:hypothetical protein